MLSKDQVEKAYAMVQAIPAHEMDNSDEMAYFTLLKTEAAYRDMQPIDNDSIDIPVFYLRTTRTQRSARSCLLLQGMHPFFQPQQRYCCR